MPDETTTTETPTEDILLQTFEPDFFAELCVNGNSFTVEEFNICTNYIHTNLFVGYASLFIGLVLGVLFSKGLVDGWKS